MFKKLFIVLVISLTASLLSGCATTDPEAPVKKNDIALYEVHKDGRIYVFYDKNKKKKPVALIEQFKSNNA